MTSWLRPLLTLTGAFACAGLFAVACDTDYDSTAFRCNPSGSGCPDGYVCCSDDPAAINPDDLSESMGAALPDYMGSNGNGVPIFSAANNDISSYGYCIEQGSVHPDGALADVGPGQGCPIPCNPTWAAEDIAAVCGNGTICCQTTQLKPEDCVLDPNSGCYRPADGSDIGGLTNWSSSAHATHQDPNGKACEAFAAAGQVPGVSAEDVLVACYRQLNVADQRGYCLSAAAQCPINDPAYIDACAQRNAAEGLGGC